MGCGHILISFNRAYFSHSYYYTARTQQRQVARKLSIAIYLNTELGEKKNLKCDQNAFQQQSLINTN